MRGPTPEGDPDLHHPGYFRDRPDILAAMASVNTASGSGDAGLDPAKTGYLLVPGPYNPAAVIPPKVVKKILDLEFVDMFKIAMDDDVPQTPGRAPAPARLPVTKISQWLERYLVMSAIFSKWFPEKALELHTRPQSSRQRGTMKGDSVIRHYCQEALARKDQSWTRGYTTKPSRGGPELSHDVYTASVRTT